MVVQKCYHTSVLDNQVVIVSFDDCFVDCFVCYVYVFNDSITEF